MPGDDGAAGVAGPPVSTFSNNMTHRCHTMGLLCVFFLSLGFSRSTWRSWTAGNPRRARCNRSNWKRRSARAAGRKGEKKSKRRHSISIFFDVRRARPEVTAETERTEQPGQWVLPVPRAIVERMDKTGLR